MGARGEYMAPCCPVDSGPRRVLEGTGVLGRTGLRGFSRLLDDFSFHVSHSVTGEMGAHRGVCLCKLAHAHGLLCERSIQGNGRVPSGPGSSWLTCLSPLGSGCPWMCRVGRACLMNQGEQGHPSSQEGGTPGWECESVKAREQRPSMPFCS